MKNLFYFCMVFILGIIILLFCIKDEEVVCFIGFVIWSKWVFYQFVVFDFFDKISNLMFYGGWMVLIVLENFIFEGFDDLVFLEDIVQELFVVQVLENLI